MDPTGPLVGPPPPRDPLAHRRGEPRLFAFLWTLYLLAAVTGSILWQATPHASSGGYRPAARTVLVVMAAGVVVLWPMTRLSQAVPKRGLIGASAADVLVVLLPVQIVLWPLSVLAHWPLDAVGALSLAFAGWGVVVGAIIPLGLCREGVGGPAAPYARSAWMLLVITLAGAAPALTAVYRASGAGAPAWLPCASLFTAIFSLTGGVWNGPRGPVRPDQWVPLGATVVLGTALWALTTVPGGWFSPRSTPTLTDGPRHGAAGDSSPARPWTVAPGGAARARQGTTAEDRPMELITAEEKQHLEQRLAALVENRPAISQRIAEARALGDLKENGDYHAAREEQGMQEAEIRRLTERLANASVVDDVSHKSTGVVFLGATIRIREVGDEEVELFRLVGEASGETPADYVEVTLNSPMGEALLKAHVGETINVRTPRGVKQFEILEIV